MLTAEVAHDGFVFPEGLRWRDGALWFSDQLGGDVWRVEPRGRPEVVCTVPGGPSGLGWLPDGRMLVVSMREQQVLRREPDGSLAVHADLAAYQGFRSNDMLVDSVGRAYVGSFGFDIDAVIAARGRVSLLAAPGPPTTVLVRVDPDGSHRAVATDLAFPNGIVLLAGGRVMVVAETIASRLTAYDVAVDGALTRRRPWAALTPPAVEAAIGGSGPASRVLRRIVRRLDDSALRPALDRSGISPDGTCVGAPRPDGSDTIWVANARYPECLRVAAGGEVVERVRTSQPAFACALGGADGRSLFVATAPTFTVADLEGCRDGRIEVATVVAGD